MKPRRFFWTAHPARAMLEAWLIGLLILFLLSLQVGIVVPAVLSNGLLFLCGVCGMWAVLRIRLPQGNWLRQALWELAVGLALSTVMVIGMRVPALLLGWEGVWLQSSFGNDLGITLLLLATGPGYLIARGGVRVWLLWDRLRHQRMLWAIAHAQLTVVVLVILLGAAGLFLLSPYSRTENLVRPDSASVLTSITERLLHTFFPGMSMVIAMTVVTLLVLLPPSALFSFLIARRTTRRLEGLVGAARALREGRYDTRVEVVGEDEVAQLQSDFNAMADDLERTLHDLQVQRDRVSDLLESRRGMVANVSHELRTPVATVRATLESVLNRQSGTLHDDLRHDLEVMDGEIARLQRLIDDLFTLARADAGGLAMECQAVDVGPVVRQAVEALAPLAWNSGRVEVVAELPPELPAAQADGARLGQVLSNLLRNAIRHTPPGGIVAVLAVVEEEALRIQVRDTGEGIAPEDLPHIWERFYRGGKDPTRDGSGAGLGLALVKELTEAMGGRVDVDSTVGQGSCFILRLPRA
jgi:signal transduction histidine kinase